MVEKSVKKSDVICQNCGSINDYRPVMKSNQNTAWCNGCDKFIKNLPQGKPPMLFFGKYKGRLISTMLNDEEIRYLQWMVQQAWCKAPLSVQIVNHLDHLKGYPKDFDPMDDHDMYRGDKIPSGPQEEGKYEA